LINIIVFAGIYDFYLYQSGMLKKSDGCQLFSAAPVYHCDCLILRVYRLFHFKRQAQKRNVILNKLLPMHHLNF